MRISCYVTSESNISKTFCTLAEKCYYGQNKTLVITGDDLFASMLDQVLWTYSKQHFIPHALSSDPQIEMHPIVIAKFGDEAKLPRDFSVILFVNTRKEVLVEYASDINKFGVISRIICLCDDIKKVDESILVLSSNDKILSPDIEKFTHTPQGWHKYL